MSNRDAAANNTGKGGLENELARMKAAGTEIQMMRVSAQRELQMARQARAEAERYLREIETRARSQAQLIILSTRVATKKQITEIGREAGDEMQKALADIRSIRNAAQQELEAQQKFTKAARIKALLTDISERGRALLDTEEEAIGARKV